MYAVIGTSPFADESVAVGPFRNIDRALTASSEMEIKGWVTEIVTLQTLSDVDYVTNEEGWSPL